MLECTAEGVIVKRTDFETKKGRDGMRLKLKCKVGDGDWTRTINVAIFSGNSFQGCREGDTIKVVGLPKSNSMIGDDGKDFSWIEIVGAKVIGQAEVDDIAF